MEERDTPKSKGRGRFLFIIIVALIALTGYAGAYYYYNQYKQTKIVLDNPEIASKNEVKEITEKLGKIYKLPEDEEPTVATVLDKEKLKDQPFFAKAENGDKVVIYTKSQIAILYRVTSNMIINVAPVSLSNQQQAGETPGPSTKPAVIPSSEETPISN